MNREREAAHGQWYVHTGTEVRSFDHPTRKEVKIMMTAEVKGNTLYLSMPVDSQHTSKSGKSVIRFTTSGFMPIVGTNLKVSVNVIETKK